ncbi:hypothetical protein RvY_09461 [Ramazzottius varieornatus]|uniref:Uncharacterized protein n=1 Tax=Ramazzottius varieornatus TaxID=947166 RepID=A0A1D1VEX1_RAMVA|nr:hypothetical protein RvY_09461 [Ramazzottius varieornatus]
MFHDDLPPLLEDEKTTAFIALHEDALQLWDNDEGTVFLGAAGCTWQAKDARHCAARHDDHHTWVIVPLTRNSPCKDRASFSLRPSLQRQQSERLDLD